MARARSSGGHEGHVSTEVTDALKEICPRCGGTEFMLRTSFMDANSATEGCVDFKALLITAAGGDLICQIALCAQCGYTWVPVWFICDVGASNGTTITMTNLDQASTADLLAGCYMIYLGSDANDAGEYFIISTNTAAAPTVITPTVAPHADSDGYYLITNKLPTGMTAAS
jgi:hypothetical protein